MLLFAKAVSLNDICRYAYNFNFTSSCLFSLRRGKKSRVFALCETLGKKTLACYVDMEHGKDIDRLRYVPPSEDVAEVSEVTGSGSKNDQYSINVIGIDTDKGIESSNAKGKISLVRLRSVEDLIVAAIKKAAGAETVPHVYAFLYKGERVMAALQLFDELEGDDGTSVMYYAYYKGEDASFARYNYTENSVDFANVAGEHSYMYVKIINLAEKFPFFEE